MHANEFKIDKILFALEIKCQAIIGGTNWHLCSWNAIENEMQINIKWKLETYNVK